MGGTPPADRAPLQEVASAENSCSPEGRGDPQGQKGTQRPHHPHELLLRPAGDTPALRFQGPECLLPGPQFRHQELGRWTAETLQEHPQGQATPPHSADLSQTSGSLHPLQRGELETPPGGTEHVPTVLVTIRPGGCRAPRGRQNPSTSVCPHTWDSLLAFDMHCQILNFTIHSTFQLSTHGKRRTFVEGLPLNTSEIPPNARAPPPTPRPVQSLGCPVFGKPTGILQPKRKTPWKTPTSHLSASLLRCFLGSVVTVVVFFPLSISLSQRNAFLMRKFMKSIRFAENGNAQTPTLAGRTRRLPCGKCLEARPWVSVLWIIL